MVALFKRLLFSIFRLWGKLFGRRDKQTPVVEAMSLGPSRDIVSDCVSDCVCDCAGD